jgi:hypothetical protein
MEANITATRIQPTRSGSLTRHTQPEGKGRD